MKHLAGAAALALMIGCGGGSSGGAGGDARAAADGAPGGDDGMPQPGGGDAGFDSGIAGSGSNPTGLPAAHATQIAAGRLHACALTDGGGVRCWGYPEQGQLGNGTPLGTTDRSLPVQVTGLASGVLALASNTEADSTCAITAARGVVCWGDNTFGQLGNGSTADAPEPVVVTGVSGATAVAVGSEHACAIVGGGAVVCWGGGDYGDLGNGAELMSTTPVAVTGLTGATALALGRGQSCAITAAGGVVCWGSNIDGEVGAGLDPAESPALASPTAVVGLTNVTQLTAGGLDTCAIANGAAQCWGNNEDTELGNGTGGNDFDLSTVPVAVTGLAGVADLDAAGSFGLAVIGGDVKFWGTFVAGEQQSTPAAAPALPETATAVAGGASGDGYVCALGASGAIYCWGDNEAGTAGPYDPDAGVNYVTTPNAIASFD